jgi:glycosyltransferase involved in cell wall biosynthesis
LKHVSVIICTRNRPDLIGSAIQSVLDNNYAKFDVVVVDQSDNQDTRDIVNGIVSVHQLHYIHTRIAGLSRAYNIGIRQSTGEILAFTDDDCVAPTNWIESIAEAFESEPDAEMLYGQVLRPDSLRFSTDALPTLAIDHKRRLSREDGFRIYGMGANFAARRTLFDRIGYFDEVLGGGGPLKSSQDFDLQYRAFLGGATILLSPTVVVDHYGVRNPKQWPATERAYGFGDGAFYFKHVRCGDLLALRLMLERFGRVAAGELLRWIRPKTSQALYLKSAFEGARASLQYEVDRHARLYVARTCKCKVW